MSKTTATGETIIGFKEKLQLCHCGDGIEGAILMKSMKHPIRWHRLLAVDPSLTCSGWALFEVGSGALLGTGKLRALPPHHHLADRLKDLQTRVMEVFVMLRLGGEDVLVCEAPTTMRDPKAAIKVEQVRCIFENLARIRGMRVPGRINPRTVHGEVLRMSGAQQSRSVIKEAALQAVVFLFGSDLTALGLPKSAVELKRHQDIVDAILIGYVSVARVQQATRAAIKIEEFFQSKLGL